MEAAESNPAPLISPGVRVRLAGLCSHLTPHQAVPEANGARLSGGFSGKCRPFVLRQLHRGSTGSSKLEFPGGCVFKQNSRLYFLAGTGKEQSTGNETQEARGKWAVQESPG